MSYDHQQSFCFHSVFSGFGDSDSSVDQRCSRCKPCWVPLGGATALKGAMQNEKQNKTLNCYVIIELLRVCID